MTPALAVLEFGDYVLIAGIASAACFFSLARAARPQESLRRLELQLNLLQQKLDILLKHHGIELPPPPPSGLSPEVERLARDPSQKIAAIKLYREQNPGVGLAEAKAKVEDFYQTR